MRIRFARDTNENSNKQGNPIMGFKFKNLKGSLNEINRFL